MEHRDVLLDEIKQLEKVFSRLLAVLRSPSNIDSISKVETELIDHLGVDIFLLLEMEEASFIKTLLALKVGDLNLEHLSDTLGAYAVKSKASQGVELNKRLYLEKAILILEYLISNSENYSLQWGVKVKQYKMTLSNLN